MTADADDDARLQHLRTVAKRELRARMRSVRNVLPDAAVRTRSEAAIARSAALPEFAAAQVIVGFSAIRKEIDPNGLLQLARAQGKRVGLPRVVGEAIDLHQVDDASALVEGAFGVLEPVESAPLIAPASVDIVLVPGLAFDARGHRIGYGRAFYDRLLPRLTRAFRVGLGYDFQMLAELPNEAHDVPLHCVVSDARVLRVGVD